MYVLIVLIRPANMSSVTRIAHEYEPPLSAYRDNTLIWKAGLITALVSILFWDVLLDMAHDWWVVPALSHGLLLPPLALYIAWQQR